MLDISTQALNTAQRRLGKDAGRVHWLRTDLLAWAPTRSWDIWHDRAVLHLITSTHDQDCYLHILDQATHPGSIAVMATDSSAWSEPRPSKFTNDAAVVCVECLRWSVSAGVRHCAARV